MAEYVKQHFVPRVILRRFASESTDLGRLTVVDRVSGNRRSSTVANEAHKRYLYAPKRSDGSRDLAVEKWLGGMENNLGLVFDAVIQENRWPLPPDMRLFLAQYISLQWNRTPVMADLYDKVRRVRFSGTIESKGREWFDNIVTDAPGGLDKTDLDGTWEHLKHLGFDAVLPSLMWPSVIKQALEAGKVLAERRMVLARTKEPVATTDRAVGIVPTLGPLGTAQLGLLANLSLYFPINRHRVVIVEPDEDRGDAMGEAPSKLTRVINGSMALSASRWIYHHPADDPLASIDLAELPIPDVQIPNEDYRG